MKKIVVACLLVVGAFLVAPGSASAQATGDVDVSITVNGFVILYYYDTVAITIPSNVMAQALAGADANGGVGSPLGSMAATSLGAGVLTAPNATAPGGTAPGSDATLTIQNAWSIRGLTANGVDVAVLDNGNDLTHASAGTIEVDQARCAGSCTDLDPTLGSVLSGGVELDLDFAGVTGPGTFSSAATYTITATVL